jgi:hypothetical protein
MVERHELERRNRHKRVRGEFMEQLSDQSLFALIKNRFKESLSALAQDHKDWVEYDNLYLAKHWSDQRVSWRPDPVINYISYVVDTKAPQLTNSSPTGIVIPTSQGDDDVATIFTEATTVITDRVGFDDKIDETVRTGLLLGVAWMKFYWDNSIVGGSKSKGTLYKGDVEIDLPDPMNMYHDIQANCVEECRYIIYAIPKPVEWIQQTAKDMFGVSVTISPEQEFMTEIYNRPGRNTPKENMAMWYEYWEKDVDGVHCTYAAGGNILKRIPNASPKGLYPFVTFIAKKKRKSLLGIGEPKNLVNNQKLLNKLIEMPTTSAMFTSNPMLLVKANNGIEADAVAAVPGRVYTVRETNGAGGPAMEWIQPPVNGTDVFKLAELMTTYIEKIGGIYDSNTGATPTGVTAAAAIQMLQDQASIPIKGIGRNLNNTIKQGFKLMIELIKENYTEIRHIRVMNDQGKYDFKPFQASQHAEVDLDVKIGAGASTPTSTAYIAQLSQDLFKEGILLKSEYVNMQQGLPDKDKIVDRLRKLEAFQAQYALKDAPRITIQFADLPVSAKAQLLSQVGVNVQPQDFVDTQQAQQPASPQQPMDPHSPAMEMTKLQMEQQQAEADKQHELQKIALQHQSNTESTQLQGEQKLKEIALKAGIDAHLNEQKAGHQAQIVQMRPPLGAVEQKNKR